VNDPVPDADQVGRQPEFIQQVTDGAQRFFVTGAGNRP
jgi:hypothetical protein